MLKRLKISKNLHFLSKYSKFFVINQILELSLPAKPDYALSNLHILSTFFN